MSFFKPPSNSPPHHPWIWLLTEVREIQHALRYEKDPKEIALLHALEDYVFEDMQHFIDHFYETPAGLIRYDLLDPLAKQRLQDLLDRLKRHEIE